MTTIQEDIQTIVEMHPGWISSTEIAKCLNPARQYLRSEEQDTLTAMVDAGRIERRWIAVHYSRRWEYRSVRGQS